MILLSVILNVCLAVEAFAQNGDAAFWTQFPLSKLQFAGAPPSSDYFTVSRYPFTMAVDTDSADICIYDPIRIHWNTTSNYEEALGLEPVDCSVAFSLVSSKNDNNPRLVTAASIMQQQQDFMISRQEVVPADGNASLECFLDAEHCQLTLGDIKVDSTSVDDEGSIQRKLLIYFSVATNQPELYTAQASMRCSS